MFSLNSPQRGDSIEYTQDTIFNIIRKSPLIIPKLQLLDFFEGTQERVCNSRGNRPISVRTTEALCMTSSACSVVTLSFQVIR